MCIRDRPLPVGRERLITLPAPAALHVPSDMARVARIEIIAVSYTHLRAHETVLDIVCRLLLDKKN